jgi:hypothetical protein
MSALVAGVLLSSLAGSVHCAGMCGPLVAAYAGLPGEDASWRQRAFAHALYSLGRLLAYATLGALAGGMGGAIDLAGSGAGIARAAEIVAGTLVTLWGVHALLAARGVRVPRLAPPTAARRILGRAMGRAAAASPAARAAVLGLCSALLPCGWLYAFVATAASTGHAVSGVLVMTVFWAGTIPVMAVIGEGVRSFSGPFRRHLPALSAVAIIAVGLLTVWHRADLPPATVTGACHANR